MRSEAKFHHGGQLDNIKQSYPEQLLPWIDLSTGISPFSYPINENVGHGFKHLPQGYKDLTEAAAEYYGVQNGLPIPGSMWAIQHLPLIKKVSMLNTEDHRPVLIPRQGFNEHKKAWAAWGFNIEYYDNNPSAEQLESAQACIIINPNNPTGFHYEKQTLLNMHKLLASNNAWLIVDEAFIDLMPEQSCVAETGKTGLIVLRSFGKYFGLPGIRLGSIMASDCIISEMQKLLNEWSINSVAQQVASTAYLDSVWQYDTNKKIKAGSNRLKQLLDSLSLQTQGTDFFQTYVSNQAELMYQHLLSLGIYVRLLDDKSGIRIGLPSEEAHWIRLEDALKRFIKSHHNDVFKQLELT